MKNFYVGKLVLFFAVLFFVSALQAGKNWHYCWDNEEGVRECGDYIPSQYSQKGFFRCRIGSECEYVKPAPTPEEIAEIARKKEEERKRKLQEKKDRALLALFATEDDIENARKAVLETINGQIQSLQTIINGLKGNLENLKKSYEFSKKNPDVSKEQLSSIQRNIASVKKRLQKNEETLQDKRHEKDGTNKKYDKYLQQFRNIQRRGLPPKEE
jgi:archaellum component FlaC